MEKKAVDFVIKTRSITPSQNLADEHSVARFQADIKMLLDDGWDVLSSQCIGLDQGGGIGGAGNPMMCVTLVKYGYFEVVQTPAAPAPTPPA